MVFAVYLQGQHNDAVTTVDCSQRIVVRSVLCQETAAEIIYVTFANGCHYRFRSKGGRQNRHFDTQHYLIAIGINGIAIDAGLINRSVTPLKRKVFYTNGYGVIIQTFRHQMQFNNTITTRSRCITERIIAALRIDIVLKMNRVTYVYRAVDCIVVFAVYLQGQHNDAVTTVDCSQRIVVRSVLCQETAAEIIFIALTDRYHYRFHSKGCRQNCHFDTLHYLIAIGIDGIAIDAGLIDCSIMPLKRQVFYANGYRVIIQALRHQMQFNNTVATRS